MKQKSDVSDYLQIQLNVFGDCWSKYFCIKPVLPIVDTLHKLDLNLFQS